MHTYERTNTERQRDRRRRDRETGQDRPGEVRLGQPRPNRETEKLNMFKFKLRTQVSKLQGCRVSATFSSETFWLSQEEAYMHRVFCGA